MIRCDRSEGWDIDKVSWVSEGPVEADYPADWEAEREIKVIMSPGRELLVRLIDAKSGRPMTGKGAREGVFHVIFFNEDQQPIDRCSNLAISPAGVIACRLPLQSEKATISSVRLRANQGSMEAIHIWGRFSLAAAAGTAAEPVEVESAVEVKVQPVGKLSR